MRAKVIDRLFTKDGRHCKTAETTLLSISVIPAEAGIQLNKFFYH